MGLDVSVRIASHREATRDEWVDACKRCGHATFFHTPYWVDVFSCSGSGSSIPASRYLAFSDGSYAILPLVCREHFAGLLRLYWSMPAFGYGGWVSSHTLAEPHARAAAGHLAEFPDLIWRENPYDSALAGIEIPGAVEDYTHTIDLRNGIAGVENRFDHAHRKAVKKALAAGVTIEESSTLDEWRSYFLLYTASRERWREKGLARSRGYDWQLIEAIYHTPSAMRKLWLASIAGEPVAGILCFYWNSHAVAWLGAGSVDHFKNRPNNLLYEHAIRHAVEGGYCWFDCNPSAGLKGVVEFKEHLGAVRLRSRIVNKRSLVRRGAEWIRSLSIR